MKITCKECGKPARVSKFSSSGICNPCASNKQEARYAESGRIVDSGKCPDCGMDLKRNLSLTGWWQCSQFGAEGFRVDSTKPACSFQTFTR